MKQSTIDYLRNLLACEKHDLEVDSYEEEALKALELITKDFEENTRLEK